MPQDIALRALRPLVEQGAGDGGLQIAEVLPEEEYHWAHLPGALHVPLKDFDDAAAVLVADRPVVTYCHDMQCDMSPRAAAALERLGFAEVADYGGGKMDWLSNGLPYEGTADLIGRHLTDVPVCHPDEPIEAVLARLDEHDSDLAAVVLDGGVLAGAIRRAQARKGHGSVAEVMVVGVGTVRPSEEADALTHRMVAHAGLHSVLVTTSAGLMLGQFIVEELREGKHAEQR
jgi:rhodanese-related sulfurtransferase